VRGRLAGLTVAVVLAVLLTATQAAADAAFEDPEADQRNTVELVAPDITDVQISNTRNGVITIRVAIGNYQALPPHSAIVLLFDLDRSINTGDQGFEYAVSHTVDPSGRTTLVLERWDEAAFRLQQIPADGLTSTFSGGIFTVSIPRSALGNTIGFEFGLYAAAFDEARRDPAVDSAPNTELWNYDLAGLPAPQLTTQRFVVQPARPVAGRAFTVQTLVRRADTGSPVTAGTVACSARIAKAKVRAVGGFSGGLARCVVSVPRNAKGKTLQGTMTVRAIGSRLNRAFSYRIG
jgi:hypothetical protein